MSGLTYEKFKEEVLDVIHEHMSFHETPPSCRVVLEDAFGSSSGPRYDWLNQMKRERLVKYIEGSNGGTLVAIREEQ